ncbi:hypothetical protein C4D60_Mb03t16490 [Musa balbisiana]|uniref:Uncharacterized protein n=1 Tax=Musa balbisiana TaxID=52838 RepID=A0A4S8JBG3_MUSBA|nr:hypothetical protein C4D60_Mb03t16490 [Musa balbisiana]
MGAHENPNPNSSGFLQGRPWRDTTAEDEELEVAFIGQCGTEDERLLDYPYCILLFITADQVLEVYLSV